MSNRLGKLRIELDGEWVDGLSVCFGIDIDNDGSRYSCCALSERLVMLDPRQRFEILLVEDNPADVLLTQEAFREGRLEHRLSIAQDGEEALLFLRREGRYGDAPRPDVILLDLNLPKKDGRELLAEIKEDPGLQYIPIIVLTTSEAEQDIWRAYRLHANCYLTKPLHVEEFIKKIRSLEDFWLTVVRLPTK